jgi:rhodanese-related sulfurtransferase
VQRLYRVELSAVGKYSFVAVENPGGVAVVDNSSGTTLEVYPYPIPPGGNRAHGSSTSPGGDVMLAKSLLVWAFSLTISQAAAPAQRPAVEDAIVREAAAGVAPQVTTAQLRELLRRGDAVLLDARPREEFAMSHIPGAVNVGQKPGSPVSAYVPDVVAVRRLVPDRNRTLVVYCNGPFCGKSRRVAEELVAAGYRDVRCYQLGMPGWRTAGGVAVVEAAAIRRVAELDATAVFVDAGLPCDVVRLPRLVGVGAEEVERAKDDGRLPMTDHNTRIIVIGPSGARAPALAEVLAANAFHNVAYFDGDGALLAPAAR